MAKKPRGTRDRCDPTQPLSWGASSHRSTHFDRLTKTGVIQQCETSLRKMGIEHIDLLYLHWPEVKTEIEETLDGISVLHDAGKFCAVRFWVPSGASLAMLLQGLEAGSCLPDIPERSLKDSRNFHESSGSIDESLMKVVAKPQCF